MSADNGRRPHGSGSIFVKRGIYGVQIRDRNRRYRESTGLRGREGETAARKLLRDRLREVASGKYSPDARKLRLDDLERLAIADYEMHGRPTRKVRESFRHLRDYFTFTPAMDIPRGMSAYIAHRLKEGAGAGTIRREVGGVRRGFTLAVRDGLVLSRPSVPNLPPAPPRQGFVTEKEWRKIEAALPEYLRAYFGFLFLSGWRSGRAKRLTWVEVDLERGEIRLEGPAPANKGTVRVLPFSADPRLDALIRNQWKRTQERQARFRTIIPTVFWHPCPTGAKPLLCARGSWETACKAAGRPKLLIHDLRRSRARLWSQAGVPDRVGMALGGWKTRSVYDRYAITSADDMAAGLRRAAAAEERGASR